MKKITIALIAIAMTAVSQAASIDWRVTIPGKGADYKDYRVYICESVVAFQNEDQISSYLLGSAVNTGTIAVNRGDGAAAGTLSGLSNDKSGQIQNFYVVIVAANGSGYWKTEASAQIYTTETSHTDFARDVSTMLATPMTMFGTSPVPEPTSGLMLVLGVGLMALKRKRA